MIIRFFVFFCFENHTLLSGDFLLMFAAKNLCSKQTKKRVKIKLEDTEKFQDSVDDVTQDDLCYQKEQQAQVIRKLLESQKKSGYQNDK